MLATVIQRLAQFILPTRCALCQRIGPDVLCSECRRMLEPVGALYCLRCGRRRQTSFASPDCAECHGETLGMVRGRSLYIYNEAARNLLAEFKFKGNTGAGKELAADLANWVSRGWNSVYDEPDAAVDLVVPVPLFPARKRERRFNQAELPARVISSAMGVTCRPEVLERTRRTETQVGLSANKRRLNVQGAFAVPEDERGKLKGKRVLLVDDLMTTGSTLWACSVALRKGGAAAVYGLTIMSTVRAVEPVKDSQ